MEILINLPLFPGFDDEAPLSLYEHYDPEEWVIEVKLSEIQEKLHAKELTYSDLTFNQMDYERAAKSAWIEEWGRSAPKGVVESVEAPNGYCFSPNTAMAKIKLKDGWQEVMNAFMQDNETWLKENCDDEDQEHYLESQDYENWPKYLFQDYDKGAIADMIGLMMIRDYDNIDDDISYNLIAGALNNIDIRSYVFLTKEGLVKLVERQLEESECNEQDEEIRILSNIKKWHELLTTDCFDKDYLCGLIDIDRREVYLDTLQTFVETKLREKYRKEWYKNYIGTKKITFDGPTKYKETGEITDEDISAFMSGAWNNFLNYRLKVGHTERQDRFTAFMRDYPQEILDWMRDGWNDEVIPYYFYEGLAKGGEYELYGCSKDEFINILRSKDFDDLDEEFEYAAVLEEVFGIDFAVDYLMVLNWNFYYEDYSIGWVGKANPTIDFIINTLKKAINNNNNEKALKSLAYFYMAEDDEYYPRDLSLSIKLMSRLSTLWKKSIISDDWLTGPYGLAYIVDFEWGDDFWEEDEYPECPDEDVYRIWLIKLLESDFAEDIADYLKPLLEMVLEREKNHNWETGKKAIEAFLAKTSNK